MEEYKALEMGTIGGSQSSTNQQECPITSTDLDAFLSGVYRYYTEKGFRSVMYRSVSNLIASIFTFVLSGMILLLIDWGSIAGCVNEESCRDISLFYSNPIYPLTTYRFIVLCQLVPLGLYTVVLASLSSIAKMREAIRVGEFFKSGLGIQDDTMLKFMTWEELVLKIVDYQQASHHPLCIVQETLSPIEITNIIMRSDNILLQILKKYDAKFNQGGVYIWQIPLQSSAIQWVIQHGVIAWLFTDRYRIRQELVNKDEIRNRLHLIGIVSLALIGPIFIFTSILLFIKEADDVRSNRSSLFDGDWTALCRIVLRHYSEMEHVYENRICGKEILAQKFSTKILSDNSLTILLKSIKFIASGIVGVLAIVALIQDSALLYISIFGRNLFWYLAIFSGIVAASHSLSCSTNRKQVSSIEEQIGTGIDLVKDIHYLPSIEGSESFSRLKKLDKISEIFQFKFLKLRIFNILNELVGILLLPFYFLLVFPETLVDLIVNTPIISNENLGDFASNGFITNCYSSSSPEKVLSLVSFIQQYPNSSSGLDPSQLAVFCELEVESKNNGEKSTSFWYLLKRSMENDHSLVQSSSIINMRNNS